MIGELLEDFKEERSRDKKKLFIYTKLSSILFVFSISSGLLLDGRILLVSFETRLKFDYERKFMVVLSFLFLFLD